MNDDKYDNEIITECLNGVEETRRIRQICGLPLTCFFVLTSKEILPGPQPRYLFLWFICISK